MPTQSALRRGQRVVALLAALTTASITSITSTTPATASTVATPATAPIRTVADVRYAGFSNAQVLDLYLPAAAGPASPVPLVVVVHGDDFASGDKRDVLSVPTLLNRGLAVASVNYRLTGEARFPAAVQDVKAAVRWLRSHAREYGIDPTRFALWGTSAGGYLATMAGVSGGVWSGLDDAGLGNSTVSAEVRAVVAWSAPADFSTLDAQTGLVTGCAGRIRPHDDPGSAESRWLGAPVQTAPLLRASQPDAWLPSAPRGSLPSFLLVHGSLDCSVPLGQPTQWARELAAAGASARVEIVEGAGHLDDVLYRRMLAPTADYLVAVLEGGATG